ncbi:hypothetical protein ACFW2X_14300 [Streptomyces antibioticus]|uniref:hypothetical protein n=1 Tax=Streptomyces antibioticus TaxID=1890 RepID=UPI0036C5DA13
MLDGALLGLADDPDDDPDDTEAALTAYGKELLPRGEASAAESATWLTRMAGPDPMTGLVEQFTAHERS